MIDSADAEDNDYLLRHLERTVVRVRAGTLGVMRPAPGSLEETILQAVREHPGTTVATLWASTAQLHVRDYGEVQHAVVGMIDERTLDRAGHAPLETVDPRYERLPRCPVCGAASDTHPILFWKQNTPVVQCSTCGLVYANPRRTVGVSAPGASENTNPAGGAARREGLQLLAAGRTPGRLLVLGEDNGEVGVITQAGWDVYQIAEPGDTVLQTGAQDGIHIVPGPLEAVRWPDGSFDAALLGDEIARWPSIPTGLAHVARLVRPDGLIVLTTPNIRSVSYARAGRTWPVIRPNDQLYYFAPQTLTRLLTASGFAIHSMTTVGPALDAWPQILPWPRLRPIIARAQPLAAAVIRRLRLGDEFLVFARYSGPAAAAAPADTTQAAKGQGKTP